MENSSCITEIYEDYRTMNRCKLKSHSQRETYASLAIPRLSKAYRESI